ncbi:MAG TPA: DoxX family protein [Chloroflexota bacterium]|jgi:hypothetical protein|nr:DoxX family protein [Chloroflexota bacterium]
MTYVLWTVQALLALVFLFAGGMKLVTPLDVLYAQMQLPLPGVFIRFIGICEVAGALGLILPGVTRIRPELTSLAARGLVLLMVGAVMFTPIEQLEMAVLPIIIGLLAAFVAYGRSRTLGRAKRPATASASA